MRGREGEGYYEVTHCADISVFSSPHNITHRGQRVEEASLPVTQSSARSDGHRCELHFAAHISESVDAFSGCVLVLIHTEVRTEEAKEQNGE